MMLKEKNGQIHCGTSSRYETGMMHLRGSLTSKNNWPKKSKHRSIDFGKTYKLANSPCTRVPCSERICSTDDSTDFLSSQAPVVAAAPINITQLTDQSYSLFIEEVRQNI